MATEADSSDQRDLSYLSLPYKLLKRINPSALEEIREAHPRYKELLNDEGRVLGAHAGDEKTFLADTWARALRDGASAARGIVPGLRASIRRAEYMEMTSEIGSGAASSTLLAMLASSTGGSLAKIVTGVVALACSVLAIIARRVRSTTSGQSRIEHFSQLIACSSEANVLAIHLETWAAIPDGPPLVPEIFERARACVVEMDTLTAVV